MLLIAMVSNIFGMIHTNKLYRMYLRNLEKELNNH